MLEFIVENSYVVIILIILFLFLYMMGGDDIIFFRRKKYPMDPKANDKALSALGKFARMRGFEVLGPTTLECDGTTMSFDAILIGFFGTLAVKVCPQGGDIYGDVGSENWVQIFEGERTVFPSPIMAMNGSSKLFRDIYRAENVKFGKSESMAIFTNKICNVAVARSLPAYSVKDLGKALESPKFLTDNGADIPAMKAALLKYSK